MINQTIRLKNQEGNEVDFDILGYVTYENIEYIVLYPLAEDNGEVLILEVDQDENYLGIDDDDLIEAIFEKFKEEYRDEYAFEGDEDDDAFDIEIEDPQDLTVN